MHIFFISQSMMSTCPLPARMTSLPGPTLTASSPGFSVVNTGPLLPGIMRGGSIRLCGALVQGDRGIGRLRDTASLREGEPYRALSGPGVLHGADALPGDDDLQGAPVLLLAYLALESRIAQFEHVALRNAPF